MKMDLSQVSDILNTLAIHSWNILISAITMNWTNYIAN